MGDKKMTQTEKCLVLNGREIRLLGTAHISSDSIHEVIEAIKSNQPDCVAIELDEKRYKSLTDPDSWRNLDIIKVLRKKEGFLLLANLVLASFQRRMGTNVGVKPGDEMKAAIMQAEEMKIPTVMVDRPIQITLRRAWMKNSLWGKSKLLAAMIASAFDDEKVSPDQIENLKKSSEMDSMMSELAGYLPAVKEVLIDERDRYLAGHIWNCTGDRVLAVLGAGHLPGVQSHLEQMAAGTESADTTDIADVPHKRSLSQLIGWCITVAVVAGIAAGFYFGGRRIGVDMIGKWIFWNGVLAAAGTLLAGGHPLTIIAGFIGAPITSLCPVIGVGMVTGIVQAVVCKPKVSDMEFLQQDAGSIRGFYHNRILRVLLVFFLSTMGSAAGTIIAGASFVGTHSRLFFK